MSSKLIEKYGLDMQKAQQRVKDVVKQTPLQYINTLSEYFESNVYLKREDLQVVRSYKLRGAYNMISSLDRDLLERGVVCASAGNHAQGFAYSCNKLGIKGVVFMPKITPKQKIKQTRMFGNGNIEIVLTGDTFDDCAQAAKEYTEVHSMTFIPPFDDLRIIEGQGTIAVEILSQMGETPIDYIFIPVGGGGLCSGIGAYVKEFSPQTKIIAVEPEGAASMRSAFKAGHPVTLAHIDKFVDGAAVKRVGDITYSICSEVVDDICLVPEGEACSTILKLYNENAIVVEPAGALSIAALNHYASEIRGKNVVCIVSGSNNDIDRMQEIKERSLIFERLKHYFIIRFPQRANALKDFVNKVLGERDDIVRFEYMKKNEKENGPALVGIELETIDEYNNLISRMIEYGLDFTVLDPDSDLGRYIV
ncbi:threonine dehydratase [Dysgonomonas sp. PFB1-18]|uniref:threonine ammonia-lyase IlvA n=1 Tax=unclassified Dysgonomonas TaxID=2630389 RepID=UPI002473CF4D|nr:MULTISPECIES: threonine ammonia-lyase IlvA [unclassified Dysgonomonas]MDH6310259.1 threonine dehydratase [Dysgonomonas sp. PF1-14]MDH6340077.1 threonine dehydratase [Dysgonomonas sp. PF1-16]MDH6381816.1 threonine dehydratase [Dysgonomonas sp. PFB1-18]MDH6398942.1 threonine dehydratase [Dysgonomonas sp. PF1-23]